MTLNNIFGLNKNLDVNIDVTNLSSVHALELTILNIWFFKVRIKNEGCREIWNLITSLQFTHLLWSWGISMHNFMGESIDHFLWMVGFSLLALLWFFKEIWPHSYSMWQWALTPHSFRENASLNHSWLIFCQIIDMDLFIANSLEPMIYNFRTEYLNFDKLCKTLPMCVTRSQKAIGHMIGH